MKFLTCILRMEWPNEMLLEQNVFTDTNIQSFRPSSNNFFEDVLPVKKDHLMAKVLLFVGRLVQLPFALVHIFPAIRRHPV